jgi:hypothetical protein
MTPQSFSYGIVGNNGIIYLPPYGLRERLDYMLYLDPSTHTVSKMPIETDASYEKWIFSIVVNNKIYVLPYNESSVLVIDTAKSTTYNINLDLQGTGKYVYAQLYNNKIYALPYGDNCFFDNVLIIDTKTDIATTVRLELPINNEKKWHTSQLIGNILYGMPRGELNNPCFPYRIEFNCDTLKYKLVDLSHLWPEIDQQKYASAKYTTIARYKDKLFVPPYCRNPNFDLMAIFDQGQWSYFNTGQKSTSRKYYNHILAKNGKIYFPPAGHDEDWSELMIVDGETNQVKIKELGIGKESKKYFAGCENSQGKIYYIPRGGCVCMPENQWKEFGDLTEILVIDTKDDTTYTIDVSEYYKSCTTIEKYNNCVIVNDKIFAFPYGESDNFQDILVFDTLQELVADVIKLNDL